MHPIAGRPMIAHLLDALKPLAPAATVVVIGPRMEAVARLVAPARERRAGPAARHRRRGARRARRARRPSRATRRSIDDLLVLFGDTPLLRSETLARLLDEQRRTPAAILLAGDAAGRSRPLRPARLGADGALERIVEAADASPEERAIGLVNGGLMVIAARHARAGRRARPQQRQSEFYLTDIVGLRDRPGLACRMIELPAEELIGINTRAELAEAEALMQHRLRRAAMAAGATLVAPETVFLSADTRLGRDVVVEPNVVFGPGVDDRRRARASARSAISKVRSSAPARSSARSRGCAPARCSKTRCMSAISSRSRRLASATGRQGQSPLLYRRQPRRRRGQYRRRHHHLQL